MSSSASMQDMNDSDTQHRSVSLAITIDISSLLFTTFSISLSFLNMNLNWVALSEIELCAEEGESIIICREFTSTCIMCIHLSDSVLLFL